MTDVYASIVNADPMVVRRLAETLELRAADPQQRAMLRSYLGDVHVPEGAQVLEVGCGTGAVTRTLATWPGVASVDGIDPSPILLERARHLAADLNNVRFHEGDGRRLPFGPSSFDVVVFHTALCHMPTPEGALLEAHRVLRRGGWLAIFDGDYATTTVALDADDPLQACSNAAITGLVHDPWLVRRLPALATVSGFDVRGLRSHGYVQTSEPTYMLTIVERGADFLVASGRIGPELGTALKAEACRRVTSSQFFGHIAYASLVARRPDADSSA